MLQTSFSPLENGDPFADMHRMQRVMNRIFDGVKAPGQSTIYPLVNFWAGQDSIVMTAEPPNLTGKDIELTVRDTMLSIRGEKKFEHEEERKGVYMSERSYGSLYRNLPLPADVDTDKADATFKNGVLTVSLPKTAEAQAKAKRIPVKAA